MAKKRRRRKKNRRQQDEDRFFDDEENAPLSRGKDYIDVHVVRLAKMLGIRIQRSLFKDGGFRCVRCGFRTTKPGTNGRNSLRAHLKRHLREDKAGRHLRSLVWIGLLLVVTALTYVLYTTLGADAVETWAHGLRWSGLAGPGLAGAAITVAAALITSAHFFGKTHQKRWRFAFISILAPTFVILLAQIVAVIGIGQLKIDWFWLLSGLFTIYSLYISNYEVGLTKLRISRREIVPHSYIKMLKAKTANGDMRIIEIQEEIELMIRTGQIKPQNLESWQRQAMVTLEISGFKYR